jgi:hypothetical protein
VAKKKTQSDLFLLGLVCVVAIVGIVVMVLQVQGGLALEDNLVGEAFAVKTNTLKADTLKADAINTQGGSAGIYTVPTDGTNFKPDALKPPMDGLIVDNPGMSLYIDGASAVMVDELEPGYVLVVDVHGTMSVYEYEGWVPEKYEGWVSEKIAEQGGIIEQGDLKPGTYTYDDDGFFVAWPG